MFRSLVLPLVESWRISAVEIRHRIYLQCLKTEQRQFSLLNCCQILRHLLHLHSSVLKLAKSQMECTQAGRPRRASQKSNHRWLHRISLAVHLVCCCQFVFLLFFCPVLCAFITGRVSENEDWTWKMNESGEGSSVMILTVVVL